MSDYVMSRRRFVAASAAVVGGVAMGLAGCSSSPPTRAEKPDGVPFLERPEQDGVIRLHGAENKVIENLRFTNRPYTSGNGSDHVCILLTDCKNIIVRNVDFDTISQPLVFGKGCDNITVEWCRARGLTGPSNRTGDHTGNFMQTVDSPTNINIVDNLIIGGDTEDIISFFTAVGGQCIGNRIDGSGWLSRSGTGIILGDGGGSGVVVERNTLLNPGQVGIGIAGGQDHIVRNNTIYQVSQADRTAWFNEDGDTVAGAADGSEQPIRSNVGIYSFNFYPETQFGGSVVNNNRVRFWSDEGDFWNGFWNGDDPASVSEFDNVWNDESIDPLDVAVDLNAWVV